MDMDMKHPMRNSPATATLEGRMDSPRLTVESTPPAAFTAPVKAPAARNIRHMVMMFHPPRLVRQPNLFRKAQLLFCTKAARSAIKKGHNGRHTVKIPGNEPGSQKISRNIRIGKKGRCPSLTIFPMFLSPCIKCWRISYISPVHAKLRPVGPQQLYPCSIVPYTILRSR